MTPEPIIVAKIDGKLRISAGHHRAAAAHLLGKDKILATVWGGGQEKFDQHDFVSVIPLALATADGIPRRALATADAEGRVVPFEKVEQEAVIKHAQHDYATLAARLDALEAKSLDALRDALGESRDALVNKIRKATDFAALANDLKRLPRFGAVEMEVRAMLDRAREAGLRDARAEVREGKREFAFDPNQPRDKEGQWDAAAIKRLEQHDYAGTDSSFTPKAATRWLRATAFWVAGILGDRVLSDVKGIILNGLKTGTAGSVMAEQIFDAFLPWLGDPNVIRDEEQLAPYRLETIVRTNTTTAYNHGRLTQFLDPEIIRFVKGIRYSAILDTRTTEVCRFLDGLVFKPTDPNLESLLPPNHYNCRSLVVPIVAGEKVDASEFITPEQIGKARGLADAKFLTQTPEAWRAYSECDEEPPVASQVESLATSVKALVEGLAARFRRGRTAEVRVKHEADGSVTVKRIQKDDDNG